MEYKVGDYLVHSVSGVCQVTEIADMELMGKGSMKTYYCMTPVFKAGGKVFVPVEGSKAKIRPVGSKDEFDDILAHIDNLDIINERDDRVRAEKFKETIGEFTPVSLASVVKTVLIRKWVRLASGKKVMALDEKTLAEAGKKFYEEMAFVLDTEPSQVKDIFEEKVRENSDDAIAQML